MELCTLPQTGASEPWLVLAVVAVVLVGAGVALAVSGRARRRVATTLGALAIVGVVAVAGIGGAAPANADMGGAGCVQPAPRGAAAATVVTPAIPTAGAQQCQIETAVTIPSTTGVAYAQSRSGSTVTVTASALPGYRITPGATTTWTYDVTPAQPAPAPVGLPASEPARFGFAGGDGGDVVLLLPDGEPLYPQLATAAAAGTLTVAIDDDDLSIGYEYDIVDADFAPIDSGRVLVPFPGTHETRWDDEEGAYVISYTATGEQEEAAGAALSAQIAAIVESLPEGARIVPTAQLIAGVALVVTWGAGTPCGVQTATVPVDARQEAFLPAVADEAFAAPDAAVVPEVVPSESDAPAEAAPESTPAPSAGAPQPATGDASGDVAPEPEVVTPAGD